MVLCELLKGLTKMNKPQERIFIDNTPNDDSGFVELVFDEKYDYYELYDDSGLKMEIEDGKMEEPYILVDYKDIWDKLDLEIAVRIDLLVRLEQTKNYGEGPFLNHKTFRQIERIFLKYMVAERYRRQIETLNDKYENQMNDLNSEE